MINLILFGGLSECGKTHASKHSIGEGFTHMKIIFFEKKVMKQFGLDPKDINSFKELYDRDHNIVFEKFWEEIKTYCQENNIKNIALDSTTRVDMVEFFNNCQDVNFKSVYIETEFENRVYRESLKNPDFTFDKIKEQTINKDKTKIARGADLVKNHSVIITNNGTIEVFNKKISDILINLKNNA